MLLGKGNGSFQTNVDYAVGTQPSAVAIGDFNNDGKPDIAVANASSGTVSILLGNRGGRSAAVSYAAGVTPASLAVSDFNGDGNVDLVAGGSNNAMQVFFGKGDGTFYTGAATYYGAYSVALGDFNSDGKTDIAIYNYGAYVLLGNGDGTFGQSNYWTGYGSGGFAVGDLNGDGKLDILWATPIPA